MLEEILATETDAHIMNISTLAESNYFDYSGNLTEKGQWEFWKEVNKQMKMFDYKEIELLPVKYQSRKQVQISTKAQHTKTAENHTKTNEKNHNRNDDHHNRANKQSYHSNYQSPRRNDKFHKQSFDRKLIETSGEDLQISIAISNVSIKWQCFTTIYKIETIMKY